MKRKNPLLLIALLISMRFFSQGDSLAIPCGFDVTKFLPVPTGTGTVQHIITQQAAFSPSAIVSCGHFNIYYEDMQQNIGDGFDHPTLGAARRNTLCAVLSYMESVIDFGGVTIDLYIDLSLSGANPAPMGTTWVGQAGPIFAPGTFGASAGFYGGHFYDHVTTGIDPDPNEFDATVVINFDKTYSGSLPIPVAYWDDYQNTTPSCNYDLYSLLLHELTHALGWFSALGDDMSANHYLVNKTNTMSIGSFSKLDEHFLYFGDPRNANGTFPAHKLVDNNLLTINPLLLGNSGVLTNTTNPNVTNSIWMTDQPAPNNYKAYDGYWFRNGPATQQGFAALQRGSMLSHLDDTELAVYRAGQHSHGYQPRYVMNPFIVQNARVREWSIQEIRMLLTMGYNLNPAFAGAPNYLGGAGNNTALILGNSPPVRSTTVSIRNFPLANLTELAIMRARPENSVPDYTITNTNAPGGPPPAVLLTIDTHTMPNISDPDGQPVGILPGSIYGIRGVTTGDNDHNCIVMTNSHTITYSPPPGYHGKAEFGFRLWDGIEPGAEKIIVIDLLPGTFAIPPGDEMLINGGFEDATEVKTAAQPAKATSTRHDHRLSILNYGTHQSGGHPYAVGFYGNDTYGAGVTRKESYRWCMLGTNTVNLPPMNPEGFGTHNISADPINFFSTPYMKPLPAMTGSISNECYSGVASDWSSSGTLSRPLVSTAMQPLQTCGYYKFSFDFSAHQKYPQGFPMLATLSLVNNLSDNSGTVTWNTLQDVPLVFPVTTGQYTNASSYNWQHVSADFVYCGAPTMTLLLSTPVQTNLSAHNYAFHVDNLSLIENTTPPPPLIVTAQNSSTLFCPGSTATLTGIVTNSFCPLTYTWLPMNVNTQTVVVTPQSMNSTYTLLASDGCRTGSAVVQPTPIPAGSFTAPSACIGQYSGYDLESQLPSGTPLTGTFVGTALSLSTTVNGPRHFINLTASNGTFAPGTYTYNYYSTLTNNCVQVHTATIQFVGSPTIVATSQCILPGTPVTLTSVPPVSGYTWLPVHVNTPSLVVTPTVTTGYELSYEWFGCTGVLGPLYIHMITPVTFTNLPVTAWCADQTIHHLEQYLGSTVATTGTWTASGGIVISPGSPGTSAILSPTLSAGIHTISYSYNSSSICAVSADFTVDIQPGFNLSVSGNTYYCTNIGPPAVIAASSTVSGVSYNWLPGPLAGPTHTVSPPASTIYSLAATSSVCITSRTVSIIANTACCTSQNYISGTLSSGTLTGMYAVNHDLTITGDVSLDGEFLLSPNVKINVQPGAHLHTQATVIDIGGNPRPSKIHLRS